MGPNEPSTETVDLHSQFEGLLDVVWSAEANWRFDDRLDLAHRIDSGRGQAA